MTDLERCYASAVRILQYRWNSVVELRRKLRRKDFDAETIDATIAKLARDKWLDDERFAGAFVRTRTRRNQGRLRIKAELGAAGISDAAVARAIAENVDPAEERERLTGLCRKKIEMMKRRRGAEFVTTDDGRSRIAASLVRSGYETSLVFDVLRELLR